MKTTSHIPFIVSSNIAAICLTVCSLAQPPRPGGPGGPGGAGGQNHMPPPVAGDMSKLGPIADKFHAFQRAQLNGEKFYTKEDAEIQKMHSGIYHVIADFVVIEKLTEEQGETFTTKLVEIGSIHMSSNATGTTPATTSSLHDLHEEVKSAARQEVKEEELTPDINRVQLLMSELVRFTQSDSKLASKSSSIKRRLDDFIAKEKRTKEDRDVDDREREKLAQEATQSWGEMLKSLKR